MNHKTFLATAAGIMLGGVLFNAAPALADLPTIDITTDGILTALQSAVTGAINSMEKSVTDSLTSLANPASVSSLLTAGFTQMANYSKASVGAQQQITDASNTAMARFQRDIRNSQIRDQQTPNVQNCTALDSGQVVTAASLQGWRTGQTIEAVMDPRGEAVIGTPAYYGAGQAMEAAGQVHLSRYCSTTDAEAGLCTAAATATQNADQRASSLFGADNLIDQNGVNAANDFGTNLIQPIVPAALRGDQLTSINGQDAAARRREYNARMSLARSVVNLAIGQQTPGVILTAQQQQLLTNEGLTPPASGSWLQALSLEATRRISDVTWAAGLQAMPPASVEREIATELALSNYLAMQQYRVSLLHATIAATQLSATEETNFHPTTEMPSPPMAAN
ncbi:MAG: hypothetical protein QOF70_2845 [Acetobacteraceae bacterium]|nr:hypothetical protein [Acetobacteraceae bacterium]